MISAERMRACRTSDDVLSLFGSLGYPVQRIPVDIEEWRLGGITIPWNGQCRLEVVSRLRLFDLLLLEGNVEEADVRSFLRSYARYNQLTKSALINYNSENCTYSLYDLGGTDSLRRLRFSLGAATTHGLDRLNLLSIDEAGQASVGRIFDRALDRERITRQFFLRFRAAVADLAGALAESCRCEPQEERQQEALLLLSRLLFLSFVQEKGWLAGERRFLVDRAARAEKEGLEFFASVLLPLFFGCLNTPLAERDETALALGGIPYLNGGLFEPSRFERRNPELHVSNDLMGRILEELFERFDFSVDESDTAGTHVDPEMLGKVFESLMAEGERAASGSFYTPKELVDALTRRAIAERLAAGDPVLRETLRAIAAGEQRSLPRSEAAEALHRLEGLTILDPACGSGAFLLSALHAMERLTYALSASAKREVAPGLRQRIVERSLFGVDLKPEAVRLCELRLWLAIVSASGSAIETVAPLPNLDRNVLQGNALLSPLDFLGAHRADVYSDWSLAVRAQRDLVARYRNAPRHDRPALLRLIRENDRNLAAELLSAAARRDEAELIAATEPRLDLFGNTAPVEEERCRHLQARIAATREALLRVEDGELDFFAFDIHFAPVMAEGGFDVVAGNPPWVRNARIGSSARRVYRDRYALFRRGGRDTPFHQPDLAVAFFERAVALAVRGGIVSMLLPAKIANAAYAAPLRRFAREQLALIDVSDWSVPARRHFSADTFPLGLTVRKSAPLAGERVCVSVGGETFAVPATELSLDGPASEWVLVPPEVMRILRRIHEQFGPLEEVLGRTPLMGVKTGRNKAFFLDDATALGTRILTGEGIEVPLEALCRCVRGRDVRRWSTTASHWMLWPPRSGWRDTPPWLLRVAAARGIAPDALRLSFVRPEHVGIKVAWKDVSRGMSAVVLPESVSMGGGSVPLVPNQTLYCVDAVSTDEAYAIAALLNSTVADALLLVAAERAKDNHYRYFGRTVSRMPLPAVRPGAGSWDVLVRLSRAAHRKGRAPDELDPLVASLFDVTTTELSILRAFVEKRLGG